MAAHRAHPGFWEGFHQLFRHGGQGGGAHRAVGPTREPQAYGRGRYAGGGMIGGIGQPSHGNPRANIAARRVHNSPYRPRHATPQTPPTYPQYVGLFGVAA